MMVHFTVVDVEGHSWSFEIGGGMVLVENYLIRGFLIGLIFGVPAGVIGALTIQRTLRGGFGRV